MLGRVANTKRDSALSMGSKHSTRSRRVADLPFWSKGLKGVNESLKMAEAIHILMKEEGIWESTLFPPLCFIKTKFQEAHPSHHSLKIDRSCLKPKEEIISYKITGKPAQPKLSYQAKACDSDCGCVVCQKIDSKSTVGSSENQDELGHLTALNDITGQLKSFYKSFASTLMQFVFAVILADTSLFETFKTQRRRTRQIG